VFLFKLEHPDGTAADSPTLRTAVPNWRAGDTIPLGAARSLRVVDVRDHDAHEPSWSSRTCPKQRLPVGADVP
jgi:hypothetical protein